MHQNIRVDKKKKRNGRKKGEVYTLEKEEIDFLEELQSYSGFGYSKTFESGNFCYVYLFK